MLVLLVGVLLSLSSSAGVAAVAQPGIADVRYGTLGGAQSGLPRYGTVFLSANKTSDLAYIKQYSPSTVVPAYKDGTSASSACSSSTSTPTSCATLVDYAEALAHDNANPGDKWLLRDASGNPIHDLSYTSNYLLNIGSASYQQRALANALATIQNPTPDFDGIEFDNTNPSVGYRLPSGIQAYVNGTLLTDSLWKSSMVKFLSSVGGGLRAKGYYVAVNGGVSGDTNGSLLNSWWTTIGPYVNGLETEYFEEGPPDKVLYYNDPSDWHGHYNEWLSVVDTAQSLGKDFIGGGHGLATE